MESLGGSLRMFITVAGVAALGMAMVYGTMNWQSRRQANSRGPASAPGPASKADERFPDTRPTVDDHPAAGLKR